MDTAAGSAPYSAFVLKYIYDGLVLSFSATYAWCCPTRSILQPIFSRHMARSTRAADIGVGTGYYLEHAPLREDAHVTLIDLNPNSLTMAAARLSQAHPTVKCQTILADVMSPTPLPCDRIGGPFDSVSLVNLLHCLPGPPSRKAGILVRLKHLLTTNGALFGSTVLGKGVRHNWIGGALLRLYNLTGVMDNLPDDAESFVGPLQDAFDIVEARVIGVTLVFKARNPRVS